MMPEEMEAEANRIEESAHVQFGLAFINFQRQVGGVATLRERAAKERNRQAHPLTEEPKEKSDGT